MAINTGLLPLLYLILKKEFEQENFNEMFFLQKPTGRPKNKDQYKLKNIIISLRKKNFSIEDIKNKF